MKRLVAPSAKPIRLRPVRPNLGLETAYRRRIVQEIVAMQRDTARAILAQWRLNPPEMAQDESPAAGLRALMARLGRAWSRRFAVLADTIGRGFARNVAASADRSFASALRKAGFTVEFQSTAAWNDVRAATIAEQVSLIRSIPAEHLASVQGAVMRSVQTGRDIGGLASELTRAYGVTRRRAELIASDQNSKATAAITRVRQQEAGIVQAVWLHSAGGRTPRPSHVANSGKPYDIATGWFDPDAMERAWPGTLINCRCVSIAIIPGLS